MRAAVLALLLACGSKPKDDDPQVVPPIATASLDELGATRAALVKALEARPSDAAIVARLAEVDGLSALIYGTPIVEERVFQPVATTAPGYRSWAIGKVAFELTRVDKPEDATALAALLGTLDPDPWQRWLDARLSLVRGNYTSAAGSLETQTLPISSFDRALLLADDGDADRGLALLGESELDQVARAVLAAEAGKLEVATKALALSKNEAPRLVAYRLVAQATMGLASQRYELTADAVDKLGRLRVLPKECWLWERIAWAHLQLGRDVQRTNDHKIASITRLRCATLGRAVGVSQRLSLVDAMLQLGLGRPEAVDKLAARLPPTNLWARVTRAYALLELGNAAGVAALFDAAARFDNAARPEERAATIVMLQARAQAPATRVDALARLTALADASSTDDQRARYALGAAYYAIGDHVAAKRELRRVVDETTAQRPDPFAYRTHQLLAEIAIAGHDFEIAGPEIERAIAIHPGNGLGHAIQGKLLLRRGEPERALDKLAQVRKLGELHPAAKLVVAEALVTIPKPTADQRAQAKQLVVELKGKLPDPEVGRVAALIDPKLPGELGLPIGKLPKQGT